MRWFRKMGSRKRPSARQLPYLINPFIVDQHILKKLFQGKGYEAIRWRRNGVIIPSNTSSTGYSYCCELLNVVYVNIFHTYLITYCNYMVRSQEKNMEFMERILLGSR